MSDWVTVARADEIAPVNIAKLREIAPANLLRLDGVRIDPAVLLR